jgi:hypothetical protein
MNVTVKASSVASLKKALEGTSRKLKAEMRIAVNATANKSKSIINKEIRSELATSAKAISPTIRVKRKAAGDELSATVEVKKTGRISLREFGARQGKKGTSYKQAGVVMCSAELAKRGYQSSSYSGLVRGA